MRAVRLVRVEAPLYLALSASSPFLDGEATGYHSTRWHLFPKTPPHVPLFESHAHYIRWTEEQLEAGTMKNVRHLWCSVRPNGDRRPYSLNRLELRICDLIVNPIALLGVTALLEARLWQMMETPGLDPLLLSAAPEDLVALTDANEEAVAARSLDAELKHWKDGSSIVARDWVEELYEEVWPVAKRLGFSCFLSPLKKILREGNTAQQWLRQREAGADVRQILREAIAQTNRQERDLEDKICQLLAG
jgi:predicted glutamate--cysteine ligase